MNNVAPPMTITVLHELNVKYPGAPSVTKTHRLHADFASVSSIVVGASAHSC